jgi:hypothetical protein
LDASKLFGIVWHQLVSALQSCTIKTKAISCMIISFQLHLPFFIGICSFVSICIVAQRHLITLAMSRAASLVAQSPSCRPSTTTTFNRTALACLASKKWNVWCTFEEE